MIMASEEFSNEVVKLLQQMNNNIEKLNSKLDSLIDLQESVRDSLIPEKKPSYEGLPLDVATLLSLPDHLRKPALALTTQG